MTAVLNKLFTTLVLVVGTLAFVGAPIIAQATGTKGNGCNVCRPCVKKGMSKKGMKESTKTEKKSKTEVKTY